MVIHESNDIGLSKIAVGRSWGDSRSLALVSWIAA
jgi:hypothetical protein